MSQKCNRRRAKPASEGASCSSNASSVRRCNQSRRTRQVITVSGLDHLTGSLVSFTGFVEKVEINQSATKEKHFLVTITNEAPAD
jgi:hypothetical protein